MSLIIRVPGVFTDTSLPKLARDPIVNNGSRLLVDFKDPYCWPSQANPSSGAVVKNLVDGYADGVFSVVPSLPVAFTGSGFDFDNGVNDGMVSNIDFGSSFNPANASDASLLMILWAKNKLGNGRLTFAAGLVGVFAFGLDPADRFKMSVYNNAGSLDFSANNTVDSFAPTQLAISYKQRELRFFLNGVQHGNASTFAGEFHSNIASRKLVIGGAQGNNEANFVHYRMYIEDLAVSGADPAAQVAKDYEIGSARGFV